MIFSRRLAVLLTAILLPWAHLAFAAPAATPNVVVITIDTLRADHLGCYGYKQIRTPNIDALAADGSRFERAYTAVPVTLPSHTVMFTGTYPMLSGMHDFAANKLNATQPTLASVLKEHGYATAAVDRFGGAGLALWTESRIRFLLRPLRFQSPAGIEPGRDGASRQPGRRCHAGLAEQELSEEVFPVDALVRSSLSVSSTRSVRRRIQRPSVRRGDCIRGRASGTADSLS